MRLTWLYAPANRPELVAKALAPADGRPRADVVIVDLEDAVREADKGSARAGLAELLAGPRTVAEVHLRVNADPAHARRDLAAAAGLPIEGVRLPKVESAADLDAAAAELPDRLQLHALIETAPGIAALQEICAHPRAAGVSLGEADLRTALRVSDPAMLAHLRRELVVALAAAGKEPPVGAAYLGLADQAGLLADTRALAAGGFRGRTAIHPRQLPVIRDAFRPTDPEIDHARAIVAVAEGAGYTGAQALPDGTFIDAPVLAAARETLELADATRAE